jgi:hypothetical protein
MQRLEERTTERNYHMRMSDILAARIEALEAALREIAAGSVRSSCIARDVLGITFEEAMARAVLDKDAGI